MRYIALFLILCYSVSHARVFRDTSTLVRAAIEKARDVAQAGDFRIAEMPLTVNASNSSVLHGAERCAECRQRRRHGEQVWLSAKSA